ncbi:MAG: phosphotransferase family protein [Acidimicrobiales bacterium]
MSDAGAPETQKLTTSSRDHATMRADLERWLIDRVGAEADPRITHFEAPEANGMSSETILFDADWDEDGERTSHRLVMRLAPAADSFPVFPRYDLTKQFETMRLVAEHTDIPVPQVMWNEPGEDALGAPFFVMRRVDGIVPPDVMPYPFGSWVTEATDEERDRLTYSTVDVLVALAAIPAPTESFGLLLQDGEPHESPLRRHVNDSRAWLDWSTGGESSPLLDRCFAWLEEHWPTVEPEPVVSWGDARIGNVMYDDFRPVAVLDWEMAALAPREVDLAWFIFLHRFFDDLTVQFGMEGMPDFIRRDQVEAAYEEASGYSPTDMDWYLMYAATRHGIVFTRTSRRAAHFGDAEMPEDPDDAIMHRPTLEAMLAGTYWTSGGRVPPTDDEG